jgi:phage baseplate assembly protein W
LNYFLTGKNERMLNVGFGAGLRNLLFENATEIGLSEVKEVIIERVERIFPRVIINKLTLEVNPKTGVIVMHMTYSISETNIQDSLAINFEA